MRVLEACAYLMEKCGIDEPVFILRGRDSLAANTVLLWAQLAEVNGVGEQKVCDALKVAADMREWKLKRLPD